MIKLEVGKIYRTRNGEEVKIIEYMPNDEYPFIGSEDWRYTEKGGYMCYTEKGEYIIDAASPHDLIEEIKKEKVEEKQELKLEVGNTYRARDGEEVYITHRTKYPHRLLVGLNGLRYTEQGLYSAHAISPSEYDLIEEVKINEEGSSESDIIASVDIPSEIESTHINTELILSLLCNMLSKMEDIKESPEEDGRRKAELLQDFLSYRKLLTMVLK